MKKQIIKTLLLSTFLIASVLVNAQNFMKGTLDNIPYYVDTNRKVVEGLITAKHQADKFWRRFDTDSVFVDSVLTNMPESKLNCGRDGELTWANRHNHSGIWEDENKYEWPWMSTFSNHKICPICKIRINDFYDSWGEPVNLSNEEKRIISLIKSYINNYDKKMWEGYLPNSKGYNVIWEILFVSIENQTLYHLKRKNSIERIFKSYAISSSKYGTGNKSGSNQTPLGLHIVKEKHGNNTPVNGKMIGRVFTGQIAEIYSDNTKSKTDDITSRIFWLEGLEKGKNKGEEIDSFNRYIYIHGTSEEGRLGTPASHGCIRMKNKAVIDLYNKVSIGTLVLIL